MGENSDYTVIFGDEEGNEVRFAFLEKIAYNGADYAVLLACDDEEDPELVILQMESESDGEATYADVESEEVLDAVFALFTEKHPDDFDFAD